MATQKVCDRCSRVIPSETKLADVEIVRIYISLGGDYGGRWQEYHRECARQMTVAEVYNHKGALPL